MSNVKPDIETKEEQELGNYEVVHQGGLRYVVDNVEDDRLYLVDLSEPSCGCEDMQYNKDASRGEACKHIHKVAYVAPSQQSTEQQAFGSLVDLFGEARSAVEDIKDVRDVAQASQTANAHAAAQSASEESDSPAPSAEAKADALQAAFDEHLSDMQVTAAAGKVWFQTGPETEEHWPYPGADEVFNVITAPDVVEYVHDGSPEWADGPHKWHDDKPGEYWKNALAPQDVEAYIAEVLG